MRVYHQFLYIDPLSPAKSWEANAEVFFDPRFIASAAFPPAEPHSQTSAAKLRDALAEIKICLREHDKDFRQEVDWYQPPSPWDAGRSLVTWLQNQEDGDAPYPKRLKSGVSIDHIDLLSALLLVQIAGRWVPSQADTLCTWLTSQVTYTRLPER